MRILMYHRISAAPETVGPYYRVNTSPARFKEQMSLLRDNNYRVIDLDRARELIKGREFSGNYVVITFDDGYADFAEHAFPVLDELGFGATVFLPTALISAKRKQFNGADCLTWSEVRDLRKHRISFGSHTVSHPELRVLSWPAIRRELVDSRSTLEEQLAEKITTFAYPYAYPETERHFVARLSNELREAGYESCVTTRVGIAKFQDDLFSLKRLPVNDCDDAQLFSAKLAGDYDWLGVPQRLKKLLAGCWPKRPNQADAVGLSSNLAA